MWGALRPKVIEDRQKSNKKLTYIYEPIIQIKNLNSVSTQWGILRSYLQTKYDLDEVKR